jgi:hypothetical protein
MPMNTLALTLNESEPVPACDCDICRYRRARWRVNAMLEHALAKEDAAPADLTSARGASSGLAGLGHAGAARTSPSAVLRIRPR